VYFNKHKFNSTFLDNESEFDANDDDDFEDDDDDYADESFDDNKKFMYNDEYHYSLNKKSQPNYTFDKNSYFSEEILFSNSENFFISLWKYRYD
jgi:hypothetical protein